MIFNEVGAHLYTFPLAKSCRICYLIFLEDSFYSLNTFWILIFCLLCIMEIFSQYVTYILIFMMLFATFKNLYSLQGFKI